jgi:hypothetical protein
MGVRPVAARRSDQVDSVDIRLSVVDTDEDSARSLLRWLRDDDISRAAIISAEDTGLDSPEYMGGILEIVNVVLSNGISVGGLVIAIAGWRHSRRKPATVRIRRDDIVVELTGSSDNEIQAIIEALDQHRRDP